MSEQKEWKDDGGTAFPVANSMGDIFSGMSLRDKFADSALPAVIHMIGIPEDGTDELWDAAIAERAFKIADAMLKERRK